MSEKERSGSWQSTKGKVIRRAVGTTGVAMTALMLSGCGSGEVQPTVEPIEGGNAGQGGNETEVTENETLSMVGSLEEVVGKERTGLESELREEYQIGEEIGSAVFMQVEAGGRDFNMAIIPPVRGENSRGERMFLDNEEKGWQELYSVVDETSRRMNWTLPTGEPNPEVDEFDTQIFDTILSVPMPDGDGDLLFWPSREADEKMDNYERSEENFFTIQPTSELSVKLASLTEVVVEASELSDHVRDILYSSENFDLKDGILYWRDVPLETASEIPEKASFQEIGVEMLVAIDEARTEEMNMKEGKYWVDYIVEDGEIIPVPEPQIGLPETYEETQVIDERVVDYFMSMLVATERAHFDEVGWPEENFAMFGTPNFKDSSVLPYHFRDFRVYSPERGLDSDYNVVYSSWFRLATRDGKFLDVVGVPFMTRAGEEYSSFGSDIGNGDGFVWHFVYDNEAYLKYMESRGGVNEDRLVNEIFNSFVRGMPTFSARVFVNGENVQDQVGIDSEVRETRVKTFGLEEITRLMDEIEREISGYSDVIGREMYEGNGNEEISLPDGFVGEMENQLLPSMRYLPSF